MADYNVNMKQWNGTSFDNVLPLAYNALALNGKSYTNVYDEITGYVANNYTKCEVISHIGNGSLHGTSFVFSLIFANSDSAKTPLSLSGSSHTSFAPFI